MLVKGAPALYCFDGLNMIQFQAKVTWLWHIMTCLHMKCLHIDIGQMLNEFNQTNLFPYKFNIFLNMIIMIWTKIRLTVSENSIFNLILIIKWLNGCILLWFVLLCTNWIWGHYKDAPGQLYVQMLICMAVQISCFVVSWKTWWTSTYFWHIFFRTG